MKYEVGKRQSLEDTLSKFDLSAMIVCVNKAAALSFFVKKNAGTSGFHKPCSSPHWVSRWVRMHIADFPHQPHSAGQMLLTLGT